jgi:hypothetical protein
LQDPTDKVSKAKGLYHKLFKLVMSLLAVVTGDQGQDDDEDDNVYQVGRGCGGWGML